MLIFFQNIFRKSILEVKIGIQKCRFIYLIKFIYYLILIIPF